MKKIFGLIKRNSGPGFHRITIPLSLMDGADCYLFNAASPEDFERLRPDAIYYNRDIGDEVLELQRKYHFKIVVDMDDYWYLDPHHVLFRYMKDNQIHVHYEKHMRIADVVTTTNERLAEEIYKINKNVVIVPNAIPKEKLRVQEFIREHHDASQLVFPSTRVPSVNGKKRIFWQGSITHEKDVNILRKTMKKLDAEKFMSIVVGYDADPIWERVCDCLTDYQRLEHVIFKGTTPYEYYGHYRYSDIAIVPLLSTKFNKYKSCLKVLEAAHVGLPVIASNVHPYKDMPGVLYPKNNEDWYNMLNMPDDELAEHARILKQHCDTHFNFTEINKKRLEAFL